MREDVPADLAAVVGPLREADEYGRLQRIRQLGLYTLFVGLPAFFLPGADGLSLLWRLQGGGDFSEGPRALAVTAFQWAIFTLACFAPQLTLPAIRRARPDWESPLLASSLLKNALNKQFWLQLPCILAYTLAVALAMLVQLVMDRVTLLQAAVAFGGVVHLIVMPILAWHARRTGDGSLARIYRVLMLLAVVAFALAPLANAREWVYAATLAILVQAVVLPSIVLGLYRLMAPRRWLVK